MINKIVGWLLHSFKRCISAILVRIAPVIPDKTYLKWLFRLNMGRRLDLNNPQTFGEKMQWLKLYNRKPEYTQMVDKYEAKKYVANIIGQEYIIPTIGVWDKFDDIDFDRLPNQFVLKTTHGGGSSGVVVCKDKSTFNIKSARVKLNKSLKTCIYRNYREWPYKNVKRQIIAEEFLEAIGHEDLSDYKFYCFNGNPMYCQVIRGRNTNLTIDFYDMEWNHMPFVGLNPTAENGTPIEKPHHLKKMMQLCKKLSMDIPFSRIDFYILNDKEYFGEITFFPASGLGVFRPEKWDYELGKLIKLPDSKIC